MYLLSSSETSILNARFARVLRIGLVAAAVLVVGATIASILRDHTEAQALGELGDRNVSVSTRIHVDLILDQAYYSLKGIDEDLGVLAASTTARTGPPSAPFVNHVELDALHRAMRYDPVSSILFVRQGAVMRAVGRDGRATTTFDTQIWGLALPGPAREVHLRAPVEGPGRQFYLPVLLPLDPATAPGAIAGALVPIAQLKAYTAELGEERAESGEALYLLDGTVIARSSGEDSVRGKKLPESLRLAELARSQPRGRIVATGLQGQTLSGAYQRSPRYPFIAASAQHAEVYLRPWRTRSAGKVAMLLVALASIGWFARSLFRLNAAMASSEQTYRRLFEDVSDALLLMRPDGSIAGLNASMLRLLGLERSAQAVGRAAYDLYRPADGEAAGRERLARARAGESLHFQQPYTVLRTGQTIDCDLRLSAIDIGGQRLTLSVVRDISAERRHARQQEYLINHDSLTGLANRHSLLRTLDQQLEEHPGTQVHLVLINLARFREINEGLGPRAGDTVLEVCAQRLAKALVPMEWTLFRAGGAEFVAMATGDRASTLDALCRLVLAVLQEHVAVAGTTVEMHARLGSTWFPEDALDASQLLRCAEVAALHARQKVDPWTRYSRALDRAPGRDLMLRAEMGTAIREGQLQLFFQPKLWLEDRSIAGAEALLRWQHPERGWVSPSEFIPLAESTELIHPLTRWVLGEAVDQIHAWAAAGRPLALAVNISTNNLRDPDFIGHVKALLARRAIAPQLLELEITEGALAHNPEIVLRRLQELRDLGVGLSLDDFGTGYSSLSYVSQFPFTSIKIDRAFVSALLGSPRERQVTKSTISLGRELGLHTIAEGVEDDETAAALLALDCDIGQGYLFGRPMPVREFDVWRAQHDARIAQATDLARRDPNPGRATRQG